jgi:hypothetical protein
MKTRTETTKKANDANEKIDEAQEFLERVQALPTLFGIPLQQIEGRVRNHPPTRRSHSFPRNAAAHTSSTG